MSLLAEGMRHFWLRNLYTVKGCTKEGVGEWLLAGEYLLDSYADPSKFELRVLAPAKLLRGIAHDSTRMASAAFETMAIIGCSRSLPQSGAWIAIQAYYAAFFAAHSLLRIFGVSCLQISQPHSQVLMKISRALGSGTNTNFENGYFTVQSDPTTNNLQFRKTASKRRGSHEVLWDEFSLKLREISSGLLKVSSKFRETSLMLIELESLLSKDGCNGGNWLSQVRNHVNYRHEFGLWFPYSGAQVPTSDLVRLVRRWKSDPMSLLPSLSSPKIFTHISVCTLIVSVCYAVSVDMEQNSPAGSSFHTFGGLALARMMRS